jgi:hypothetical protein
MVDGGRERTLDAGGILRQSAIAVGGGRRRERRTKVGRGRNVLGLNVERRS